LHQHARGGERSVRLSIEFGQKIGGLMAVARALSRGDIIHAQIAMLHLEIPDPLGVIPSSAIAGRALNLAIPKGSITPIQRAAIEDAEMRAQAFGVDLIISEF
jgi:hypothetical protein